MRATLVSILLFIIPGGYLNSKGANLPVPAKETAGVKKATFLVKAGQNILVKGNLELGLDAVVEVRGTLIVEGDMVISDNLALLVTGEGKLLVKGSVLCKSKLKKSILVTETGQFTIASFFHAGDNMDIVTYGAGLVSANKVVADPGARIGGTYNFTAPDCSCSSANKGPCNFCHMLAAAKL